MDINQSRPKPGDDNLALLKDDIDSGRTGDKISTADPGLSPLGTDDEAGGNAPSPQQISMARRQETDIGAHVRAEKANSFKPRRAWAAIVMAGVTVVFALAIMLTTLMLR